MSRPFTKAEVVNIVVDTHDEKLQRIGRKLMKQLMEQLDPGRATAVLYVALTEALISILHVETPMPEVNIDAINQLLDTLRDNVKEHESCAVHLSDAIREQQAMEQGSVEPPEFSDTVTVH